MMYLNKDLVKWIYSEGSLITTIVLIFKKINKKLLNYVGQSD